MVMDMCQSVAFKRLFTCLLVLPVVALWCVPTASAQPVGENGRKLDFVYSPCVFDSCYTLFMRIARPLNSDTSLHAQLFMTRSTAPTRGVSGVFNSRQIQAYGRAKKVRKMYEEIHSNPAYDEAVKNISAVAWIDENSPPTVCAYGAHDKVQAFPASKRLAAALEEHHVPHEYIVFPHSGHGLQNDNKLYARYMDKVCEYLDTYMGV